MLLNMCVDGCFIVAAILMIIGYNGRYMYGEETAKHVLV
jgi:hypothetical protein